MSPLEAGPDEKAGAVRDLRPYAAAVAFGSVMGIGGAGLRGGRGLVIGTIKEAATQFLSERRIAVTGVSREPQGHGANFVYQRLRDRGYQAFAVNPNADEVEGIRATTTSRRSRVASTRS